MDRKYFDEIYRSDPDPWQFETSWYEQRKYALTIDALPELRYRSAFEPGCSIGVLSALLAERCDQLLATDIIPEALERAHLRCADAAGVRIELRPIPDEWPGGPFDLVVLSELAYYFDRPALNTIMTDLLATTIPAATIVGVHWRGTTNYPLTGDEAHEVINSHPQLERVVHHEESDFLLDIWRRSADGLAVCG